MQGVRRLTHWNARCSSASHEKEQEEDATRQCLHSLGRDLGIPSTAARPLRSALSSPDGEISQCLRRRTIANVLLEERQKNHPALNESARSQGGRHPRQHDQVLPTRSTSRVGLASSSPSLKQTLLGLPDHSGQTP